MLEKFSQIINGQPLQAGVITALATGLIIMLVGLFRARNKKKDPSVVADILARPGKWSSFTMLVELMGALVTALALIAWINHPESKPTLVKIVVMLILASGLSIAFLEWGDHKDKK